MYQHEIWYSVFTATVYTMAKQSKCPLTDELINKRWYIHVIEYYLAIKKNEVLIYATAQIKP